MPVRDYDREPLVRWYDERAPDYDATYFRQDEENYGGDLYRIALVREVLAGLKPQRVLDVGCGTCVPMLRLLEDGYDVVGFDLSPGMIAQARKNLAAAGRDPERTQVADILDRATLIPYLAAPFDAVVANGVMPYIADDATAHRNLADLVRPGGWYVSAYSNEIFDLATFNRFTIDFFRRQVVERLDATAAVKEELLSGLRGLLTRPDEPRSIPEGARDAISVRAHNPFEIDAALRAVGLERRDMLFYKFHAFPPLLKDASPALRETFLRESRALEIAHARDWRGLFLASTFIVVAQKTG